MNFGQLLVRSLPIVLEGKATGGDQNNIIDTGLAGRYDDDAFKDALAFVRKTTDGLAPQDQFSVIAAYDSSAQSFSIAPDLTANVWAGDYYAIADPQWPLVTVQRLANQALHNLGVISLTDDSLTVVANQRRYTLPEALWGFPIDLVEVGTQTKGFERMQGYRKIYPKTSSDSHYLEFDSLPFAVAGDTIRIWYKSYHWDVSVYSDKISHTVPEPLAIEFLKKEILDELVNRDGYINDEMMRRLNLQRGNLGQVRTENRVHNAPRKISKFLPIGKWVMRTGYRNR